MGPLAWAAKYGHLEMVTFLLGSGAPKSLPDDPPWATPLAWAGAGTTRSHDCSPSRLRMVSFSIEGRRALSAERLMSCVVVEQMQTRRIPCLIAAAWIAALAAAFGCDKRTPTPTSPTRSAVVAGTVRENSSPFAPIAGVRVDVIHGPGSGASTTTADGGSYRLEVPAGPLRLRWSKEGYGTRDSEQIEAVAGMTHPLNVTLGQPTFSPWTLRGAIQDGGGDPVVGARVTSWGMDSKFGSPFGVTETDAAGRFELTTTNVSANPQSAQFQATKVGHVAARFTYTCCIQREVTLNVGMPRIIRFVLDGPTVLRVGSEAPLTIEYELDDGSGEIVQAAWLARSSDESVVRVNNVSPQRVLVEGLKPGVATLTRQLEGLIASLDIRVE